MTEDMRWKQRIDNVQQTLGRALGQLTVAFQLMVQRPLRELERRGLIPA